MLLKLFEQLIGTDAAVVSVDRMIRAASKLSHGHRTARALLDMLVELKNLRSLLLKQERDRLQEMWDEQHRFMQLLVDRRGFPRFPVDLARKESQQLLKEIAYDAMGELYEAVRELRNAKRHRAADLGTVDRDAFMEELVDALKLTLEVAILAGVTLDELYAAFLRKSAINATRIQEGY